MAISKLTTSSEAVKFIKDGNSIVLFGGWDPMSLICELIRTGRSNLRVFAHSYSIGADMLLQSGSVETMFYSSPSKEFSPDGCDGVYSTPEEVLRSQLSASIAGTEYALMPNIVDLLNASPEMYQPVVSPFTNAPQIAAAAISPDVALLHVPRADIFGNIQLDPADSCRIAEILRLADAAKTVVVSAEQIVSSDAILQNQDATILLASRVCAVVEAPYGTYPLGCGCRYKADEEYISSYINAKANGTYQDFITKSLLADMDWSAFLNKLGFDKLMALSTNRRGE